MPTNSDDIMGQLQKLRHHESAEEQPCEAQSSLRAHFDSQCVPPVVGVRDAERPSGASSDAMVRASQERGEEEALNPDKDPNNSGGKAYLYREGLPLISSHWRPGSVLDTDDFS